MSTFDFPPSIASRPTYGKLAPRAGAAQIMLADAEGAEALLSLAKANPDLMRRAHVIYIPKDTGTGFSDQLRAAAPDILHIAPSYAACTQRFAARVQCGPHGRAVLPCGHRRADRTSHSAGLADRHPEICDSDRTSRFGRAARAMRALQRHHGRSDDRPVPMRPLRAEPVRARPLLAPTGRVSGRLHRCRRPRQCAPVGGAVFMSAGLEKTARGGDRQGQAE